jgi:hypothetical protein
MIGLPACDPVFPLVPCFVTQDEKTSRLKQNRFAMLISNPAEIHHAG